MVPSSLRLMHKHANNMLAITCINLSVNMNQKESLGSGSLTRSRIGEFWNDRLIFVRSGR